MMIWQQIKEWITEKIIDAIAKELRPIVKKINFEKAILILVLFFLAISLILMVLGNILIGNSTWVKFYNIITLLNPTVSNELQVGLQVEKDVGKDPVSNEQDIKQDTNGTRNEDVGNQIVEKEQVIFNWNIYAFFGLAALIVDFFLFVGYILLRVEKSNNRKLFKEKRRDIKKYTSKQPNELLKILKKYDREQLLPETWGIPSNGKASDEDKQRILAAYESMEMQILQAYEKICLHIVYYIYPHIIDTNHNDAVHVSIKAIANNENNEMIVISLGYAQQEYGDKQPETKESVFKRWKEMVQESYLLCDDYALYRVCNDDKDFEIFTCGDLKEFAAHQDGADKFGRFRKPNDREYNATIVCPIYTVNKRHVHIAGAICIDTTSTYEDWQNNGSYEEEMISFVSSNIGPLIKHNIDELNLAEVILRSIS